MRHSGIEALFVAILLLFLFLSFHLAGRLMGYQNAQDEEQAGFEYSTDGDSSHGL